MSVGDWNEPTIDTAYVDWDVDLKLRDTASATMFNDGVTWSHLPTNAIRWNIASDRFELYNGTSWANLSTSLTGTLKVANNLSDLASAATARTNLGLGTIAVENSPLPLNKGGIGSTTAAGGRTNLGLGTIATQAASAVSITGGDISGLNSLGLASSANLQFTSAGTITNCGLFQNPADTTIKTTGSDYAVYFATNNTIRFGITGATGLVPFADNTYNVGSSGNRVKDLYVAGNIYATVINAAADITIKESGTTYWVFGSSAKDFRPNTDATQDLGGASYKWATVYCGQINGTQTSIHLSDGGDQHIRYIASTTGDHKFYSNSGSSELYRIESSGKLNPLVVGRHDYTIGYGASTHRTISGTETLAQLTDAVATIITDLIAHGLFQ